MLFTLAVKRSLLYLDDKRPLKDVKLLHVIHSDMEDVFFLY